MNQNKTSSNVFAFLLAFCMVLFFNHATCIAESEGGMVIVEKPTVIKIATQDGSKISIYDKAFLLEKPHLPHFPPILHVQGTPHEMGFQQGVLIADRIEELVSGVGTPMMLLLGGWNPKSGEKPTKQHLEIGRAIVKLAIDKCFTAPIQEKAPDYFEEAKGMADGLKAVGSPVGMDEVLAGIALAELTQSQALAMQLAGEFVSMQQQGSSTSKNCSDFAAWGKATKDGKLVHGTNYDNEDFTIGRNGIVLIAKPEAGNAFLGMIHPGSPWPMRGMSEAGITVGEPTSNSADNDILAHPQVGHCVHMRRVLQYANNTQDAIDIMKDLGGSTGWNIFVGDGEASTAVDIQVSCTKTGIIHPMEGIEALWSTNQYTSYPGYQGYPKDGVNLVKDQMKAWGVEWEEVDTIETWQKWLKANKAGGPGDTWARYERLRELLDENHGEIDAQKVISFMSDPILSQADPKIPISGPVEHMYGVMRPIISQPMGSTFSAVFVPADQMAYIAMGAEPAQAGTYWPINLKKQMALMDTFIEKDIAGLANEEANEVAQKWIKELADSTSAK
jgi:hypothetical protein